MGVACIEACKDDGDPSCPTIDVAPAIAEKIEKDQVSSDLFKSNVTVAAFLRVAAVLHPTPRHESVHDRPDPTPQWRSPSS